MQPSSNERQPDLESSQPLRLGVAGPVGSGKTALVDALCKYMRHEYEIAVVTNDIYTKEDAQFLLRSGALAHERIVGVEDVENPIGRDPADARGAFVFDSDDPDAQVRHAPFQACASCRRPP